MTDVEAAEARIAALKMAQEMNNAQLRMAELELQAVLDRAAVKVDLKKIYKPGVWLEANGCQHLPPSRRFWQVTGLKDNESMASLQSAAYYDNREFCECRNRDEQALARLRTMYRLLTQEERDEHELPDHYEARDQALVPVVVLACGCELRVDRNLNDRDPEKYHSWCSRHRNRVMKALKAPLTDEDEMEDEDE